MNSGIAIAEVKEVATRYVKRDMPTLNSASEPIKEFVEDITHKYSNPFAIMSNPAKEASVIAQITRDFASGFKY